jgi:hypothetical protein
VTPAQRRWVASLHRHHFPDLDADPGGHPAAYCRVEWCGMVPALHPDDQHMLDPIPGLPAGHPAMTGV